MEELKLSGKFEHTLDPKGRVTLPARYREYFRNKVVLVRFPNGEPCVNVFHPVTWDRFDAKNVEPLDNFKDLEAAWLVRDIYGNQDEVEPDGQGRVLLGQHIEPAGLSGKVLIIGARDHLEIWDPETYAERRQQMVSRDA